MNDQQMGNRRRGGGIAVSGSGTVLLEPTIVIVTVGVSWQASTLGQAKEVVAAKATAARDHLVAAGVSPADLQTARLSVHTVRHREQSASHQPGGGNDEFHVATTLRAVFRNNLDSAQQAVDGLFDIVGDGLELHGLGFDCEDRVPAQVEARRLAFDDARDKATQLAELAGTELGPVRSIREMRHDVPPAPRMAGRAMMATEAAIPLEGGSLSETVEVQVRWAIEENG